MPPQRPQLPGPCADDGLAVSVATAKTLIFRDVCFDPHSGQEGLGPSSIVRWRCSNGLLQDLQVNS